MTPKIIEKGACYNVPEFHATLLAEQTTEVIETAAKEGDTKVAGFSQHMVKELFHRIYATSPDEVETPDKSAVVRKRLHNIVEELPEWSALAKTCRRDPLWSAIGAASVATSLTKSLPARKDAPPDPQGAQDTLDGYLNLVNEGMPLDPEKLKDLEKDAQEAQDKADGEAGGIDEGGVRVGARKAIEQAQNDIQDIQDAMDSFGAGTGPGRGGLSNAQMAIQVAKRLKSSPSLKTIVELAGRFRALARAKRLRTTPEARNENVGVETSGDLSRVLGSELALLAESHTEALFYKHIVEKEALSYKRSGKSKVGKGPMILVVDQSGSMMGAKDVWAKAIGLAMLDAAKAENRAFGIILYDDVVTAEFLAPDPKAVDALAILEVLSTFSGGGTSPSGAMHKALNWITKGDKAYSKADIVHITDGESYDEPGDFVSTCKAKNVSVFGIGIGLYRTQKLQSWSTEPVTAVTDVNSDTVAVNTIFDNVQGK